MEASESTNGEGGEMVEGVRDWRVLSAVAAGLLGLLGALLAAGSAAAAPGDVDLSFGHRGKVLISAEQGREARSMAVGPDDSIYVLNLVSRPCDPSRLCGSLEVRRFGPGGAPDPSFAPAPLPLGPDLQLSAMTVAADGSVLVAAGVGDRAEVVRLLPDGSRDPSFGFAGSAGATLDGLVDVTGIAERPDGRIVLSGSVFRSAEGRRLLLVMQLQANGRPDPGFGNEGLLELNRQLSSPPGALSLGSGGIDIGIRSQGPWLRAVRLTDAGGTLRTLTIWRLRPERELGPIGVRALFARRDGILAVTTDNRGTLAVALDSGGDFDRSFGGDGVTLLPRFSPAAQNTTAAVRDRAGRLVITGNGPGIVNSEPSRLLGITRLRRDGRVDRTFAAGRTPPSLRAETSDSLGVGIQSDGRIVVLASADFICFRSCEPTRYVLVRYLGGTSRARCLGHRATIVGTRKSETIVGTRHADAIAALGGNDTVDGRGGNDLICGGLGEDAVAGGPGRDRARS